MLRPLCTQGSCRAPRENFSPRRNAGVRTVPRLAPSPRPLRRQPADRNKWNLRLFPRYPERKPRWKESRSRSKSHAPVRAVYNQWTQFEEFPRFMAGVKEVRQLDDTHVHWHAEIWGKDKEWDAEITEQVPDQVIAWRSTSGAPNAGAVRFEPVSHDRTRVQADHGIPAGRRGREDRRRGRHFQRACAEHGRGFQEVHREARRRDRRLARRSARRAENAYFKTARTRRIQDKDAC